MVNGIRSGSCPLGIIIFCCTNMSVLTLQLWNLESATVDDNLHEYLGPLCKCFIKEGSRVCSWCRVTFKNSCVYDF